MIPNKFYPLRVTSMVAGSTFWLEVATAISPACVRAQSILKHFPLYQVDKVRIYEYINALDDFQSSSEVAAW